MDDVKKRKTNEEKLEALDKKLEQLKAQKKELEIRENKRYRAERTRRLIQIGALSEKYFGCENIEPHAFEQLLYRLVKIDQVKEIIAHGDTT